MIAGDGGLVRRAAPSGGGPPPCPLHRLAGRDPSSTACTAMRSAVVVPTLGHEAFGLAAVEAFARGTPAFVHRFGALAELAESTGAALSFDIARGARLRRWIAWPATTALRGRAWRPGQRGLARSATRRPATSPGTCRWSSSWRGSEATTNSRPGPGSRSRRRPAGERARPDPHLPRRSSPGRRRCASIPPCSRRTWTDWRKRGSAWSPSTGCSASCARGRPPERAVALTFDDGFASVVDHALPLLLERGFPATVFCVAGYLGGLNDWPTEPARPPAALATPPRWPAGRRPLEIGSHGIQHAPLGLAEVTSRSCGARSWTLCRAGGRRGRRALVRPSLRVAARAPGSRVVERTYAGACARELRPLSAGRGPLRPAPDGRSLPAPAGPAAERAGRSPDVPIAAAAGLTRPPGHPSRLRHPGELTRRAADPPGALAPGAPEAAPAARSPLRRGRSDGGSHAGAPRRPPAALRAGARAERRGGRSGPPARAARPRPGGRRASTAVAAMAHAIAESRWRQPRLRSVEPVPAPSSSRDQGSPRLR